MTKLLKKRQEVFQMIVAHINPTGVGKVYFYAESELMERLCLAAWPLVRKELWRLDKMLREASSKALESAEQEVVNQ